MKKVNVWTDGSCFPNPGRGGWGIILISHDGIISKASGGQDQTTNNRMEVTAVLEALRTLVECGYHILPETEITIYSDSMYVIGTLTKNYQRKKNKDLWPLLDAEIRKFSTILKFEWIKGHEGNTFNEMADKLANQAAGR